MENYSNINHLTYDEAYEAFNHMMNELGEEGAASICENFIEREAEKVAADVGDRGDNYYLKRKAELVVFRMILDKLEAAYQEELHVNETGEQPKYKAGGLGGDLS